MKKKKTAVPPLIISGEAEAGRDPNGRFAPGNQLAFKRGRSGNPAGRPKRTKLSEALAAQLAEMRPDAPAETVAEGIARALIKQALDGNVLAVREIGDRTEGKPRQMLDVDMRMMDWRALARAKGLNETDVVNEARKLIESAAVAGGAQPD